MNENTRPSGEATTAVSAPSKAQFKRLAECKTLQEAFATREIRDRIAEALPKHMDATSILRTFVQAASKSPLIYQCDLRQAIGTFLSLSHLGLTPNTPLQLVHLIPFKTKRWNPRTRTQEDAVDLNVIIGYPGYLELAHRSGLIKSVHSDVVLPGEHFRAEQGTHHVLEHRKEIDQDTTTLTPRAAYAFVDMVGEGSQFEVMSWHEIMATRNRSQAYRTALSAKDEALAAGKRIPRIWTDAPWVRDEREMARKTPFRKLAKWLPKCAELRAGVALEDAQDSGRVNYGAVIEGDYSPMDGMPLFDDDAPPPPVDPGTAHGMRSNSENAGISPNLMAARDQLAREQQAQAERAKAAMMPTPTPAPAANDPWDIGGYEAVLIDQHGEIKGEFTEPAAFARAFMALWNNAGPDADRLREHNEDTIADALENHPIAAGILAEMERPEDVIDDDTREHEPPRAIEPPVEKGRISWPSYVKQVKNALMMVEADDLVAWMDAQRDTLTRCPKAQRILLIRAMVETAGLQGVPQPPWLGDLIGGTQAAEAAPPAQPQAEQSDDLAPPDVRWVNARIREMERMGRIEFDALVASSAVQAMMGRLRRENPPLFERARAAFDKKHFELPASPGDFHDGEPG